MGGLVHVRCRGKNGRRCHKGLSPNKDNVAFCVRHGSIKQGGGGWREWGWGATGAQGSQGAPQSGLTFTDRLRLESVGQRSVPGQGFNCGDRRFFRSFF